jgi:amino acid adenylation domain-containing protein
MNSSRIVGVYQRSESLFPGDAYELSPMQEGILFETLAARVPNMYMVQEHFLLDPDTDVRTFKAAWQLMFDRHDILRTSFHWLGGDKPVQLAHRTVSAEWIEEDWAERRHDDGMRLRDYLSRDRRLGFDLSQPPLMRFALFARGQDGYDFILSLHRLLLDGWSKAVLIDELMSAYSALRRGAAPNLPLTVPFREYLSSVRAGDAAKAEAYWRRRLRGLSVPTPLPAADRGTAGQGEFAQRTFEGGVELADSALACARRCRVTANTLMHTTWALVLSRYTGIDDVVFGATTSGRWANVDGIDRLVGLLIATLPARVSVPVRLPVAYWLQQVQRSQAADREYEYAPLVDITRWSEIPKGTPLFTSLFIYQNYPKIGFSAQGARPLMRRAKLTFEHANYPLTITASLNQQALFLNASYDTARYSAAAIEGLLASYAAAFEAIVANPDRPICEVPLLTPSEQSEVLASSNAMRSQPGSAISVCDWLEAQAARAPTRPAIVTDTDHIDWRTLNVRANQFAHYLREHGVHSETAVAIMIDRGVSMIVAVLGVLKAGGMYVPLDRQLPAERKAFILADSSARLIISDTAIIGEPLSWRVPVVDLNRDSAQIAKMPLATPARATAPGNAACVLYTSGTTGQPKGVVITYQSIVNYVDWLVDRFEWSDEDSILFWSQLGFDGSLSEIFTPMRGGGRLVIPAPDRFWHPEYLVDFIARHGVTVLQTVPAMLDKLVDVSGVETGRLRLIISSAEALSRDLCRRAQERFAAAVMNGYGATEVTVDATYFVGLRSTAEEDGGWKDDGDRSVPIGGPLANVQALVLDQRQQLIPVGVAGEMYIAGLGLARGYLNQPRLTAERFLPNPFPRAPGERMYRTGDYVCRRHDGDLEFVGRRDHQVKLRGFRIELGEIEATLRQHPAIHSAVVMLNADDDEPRLVAYAAVIDGETATTLDLRKFVAARLPAYAVPSRFEILSTLPLNANGKVDRRALPALTLERPTLDTAYTMPQTEVERQLSALWERTLQVPNVGIHDNFFDLGGNSILLLRLYSLIRASFVTDLSLVDLFRYLTISALAQRLVGGAREDSGALVGEQRAARRRAVMTNTQGGEYTRNSHAERQN